MSFAHQRNALAVMTSCNRLGANQGRKNKPSSWPDFARKVSGFSPLMKVVISPVVPSVCRWQRGGKGGKKKIMKKEKTSNPKSHHNKLAAEWSCCLAERGDCCAVTDPVREALSQLAGVSMTYQTEWELTEGISATWNGELTWKQWRVRDWITASATVTDDVQRNDRRILTLLDVSLVVLCVWKSNC